MTKSLPPYNLGKFGLCLDDLEKVDVNEYIREANKELKKVIITSNLETNGYKINLTTSQTAFGGERVWFECMYCGEKKGVLYKNPITQEIACSSCTHCIYRSQKD